MSTTEPFRRGKPLHNKPETTRIVEDGGDERVIKRATVRRQFCGTGPFDKHWLNLDCCGLFCALCTYALHAYGVYAVCWILLPPWMGITGDDGVRRMSTAGRMHEIAFCAVALFAVISHFMAMTTDPGAVPPDAKPLADELPVSNNNESDAIGLLAMPPQQQPTKKLCRRCRSFKPQRAHHCSVCRRCIIKMDHHCPWVNNCVGIGNHKYFLLFVFYTMLSCVYSLTLIITRFATCHAVREHATGRSIRHYACLDHPTQLVNILGLLIEAVLFGMFTSCMIFDQWDVIFSKLTHIDRIKGPEHTVSGALAGVAEVFGVGTHGDGTRCRMDWFSPFAKACFPAHLRDEVLGFCRPVVCHRTPSPPKSTEMTPVLAEQIV